MSHTRAVLVAPLIAASLAVHGACMTRPPPEAGAAGGWRPALHVTGERHVTLLVGERTLDGDFDPLDEQASYGILFDAYEPATGRGWEAGLGHSEDTGGFTGFGTSGKAYVDTTDVYAGYRVNFQTGQEGPRPYVALGATAIEMDVEIWTPTETVSASDTSLAGYARVGVNLPIGRRARVGIDYRRVFSSSLVLFGFETDADIDELAVTFGYSF